LARGAAEEPAGSGRPQTRLGVSACDRSAWRPRGPDAGCAVVTVSAFLSGVRCPVSGASVRCPAGPVQVIGVRCGRLSVQVSSVRLWRLLCPTGMRSWGVAVGPAAARLGWPGAAWSPAVSTTARGLPEVGAWPSRLAQVVLGQRRVGFDLVVVVGRWLGRGQVDRVADRERRDAGEDRPRRLAAGGDHAGWSWCGLGPSPLTSLRVLPAGL
jgi:hypothetical protein